MDFCSQIKAGARALIVAEFFDSIGHYRPSWV